MNVYLVHRAVRVLHPVLWVLVSLSQPQTSPVHLWHLNGEKYITKQIKANVFFSSLNLINILKVSSHLVHRDLQVFLRHLGYLSLLEAPEVRIQGLLEDPCLLEDRGNLAHLGALFLLSLEEIPVEHTLVMKCVADGLISLKNGRQAE